MCEDDSGSPNFASPNRSKRSPLIHARGHGKFLKAVGVAYCSLGQSERRNETVTHLQDIQIK